MRTFKVSLLLLALVGGCGKKESSSGEGGSAAGASSTGSAAAGSSAGSAAAGSADSATGSATGSGVGGSAAADPALVERGQYLANVLGCGGCHMPFGPKGPEFEKAFAGGLEYTEPAGTWRSPNITQSKSSGIGSWSDEQIDAAIRQGVRPDGKGLIVMMPYMFYNRMTDADAKALVAFLRTVKPIENVVAPTTDFKIPHIEAPTPANQPDPVDDPMGHGKYLVTLMHCAGCHAMQTPRGPDMKRPFAGGLPFEATGAFAAMGTGTLYASNISGDPDVGIGKWTVDDVKTALKTMTRPDGRPIHGPMRIYHGGWTQLTDADLTAIATFLKAAPPDKNKVPASTFKPAGGPPAK